jgi:hypothetical protein
MAGEDTSHGKLIAISLFLKKFPVEKSDRTAFLPGIYHNCF